MNTRAQGVIAVCLFLLTGVVPAQADPITVTFTAFPAVGDPVNLRPSTGSFTFDSSLAPAGGGRIQNHTGLAVTDISFEWGHTLWTTANAAVSDLYFDATQRVLGFVLGGLPGVYGYIVAPASAVVDDIFVSSYTGLGGGAGIAYTNALHEGALYGRLRSDSIPAPTPEPSTMVLMLTGAGLLVRSRLKRKESRKGGGQ